jgi:hypothetical protein
MTEVEVEKFDFEVERLEFGTVGFDSEAGKAAFETQTPHSY